MPKYHELSTKFIWKFIKQAPNLLKYFPDYLESQLPDGDHMWMVLSSLEEEISKNMVHNARLNRSLGEERDKDELIEISKEIYENYQIFHLKKVVYFI